MPKPLRCTAVVAALMVVLTGSPALASTVPCPPRTSCGWYRIPDLDLRKQQLVRSGATALDLAIGMLETQRLNSTYPYGDGKSGDAANFGIFKQNWLMMRMACPRFAGRTAADWNEGVAINRSRHVDIPCLHASLAYYGESLWLAGHRNGATGLDHPNTPDIAAYRSAVYWVLDRVTTADNLTNDIRFWVYVPAI